MGRSYYMPSKKAEQVIWSAVFSTAVSGDAEGYGLLESEATAFAQVNTALQAAWNANDDPATRNKLTRSSLDTALKAMKTAATGLVKRIQGFPGVTDPMRVAAGLTVYKTTRTPAPVPDVSPMVKATPNGRNLFVQILNNGPRQRSKPTKVKGATVFVATGPTPPTTLSDWKFVANTTKHELTIPFPASETEETVWVTAFWNNVNDESGPASNPISVMLTSGGILPTESATEGMKLAA